MIKAVIFDCFGVLIEDALKVLREELRATVPEKADEMVDILHASHHGYISPSESNKRLTELLGMTEDEYRRVISDGEVKNQQLMEYISELCQRGYKTAILSNISTGGIDRRFTIREIEQFDAVISSSDTGYAKPEAQIYEITADKLGVLLGECVFTDDNVDFCEAARGIGMQAILYQNLDQFKGELKNILADS